MLSERPLKLAVQKTERGKISNPEYSTCRDQPTSQASPLRINDLLSCVFSIPSVPNHPADDQTRTKVRLVQRIANSRPRREEFVPAQKIGSHGTTSKERFLTGAETVLMLVHIAMLCTPSKEPIARMHRGRDGKVAKSTRQPHLQRICQET